MIERPIGAVTEFAGDPANAHRWRRRIEASAPESDGATRLGSRFRFVTRTLGRRVEQVYDVVEWEPGEQVTIRTADGVLPHRIVSTWRPVGDRVTHMVLRHRIEAGGVRRLVAPFVGRAIRRAMRRDLDDLERMLTAA